MREWFEKENPHALAEIAATLLEASRTGHWNASPETRCAHFPNLRGNRRQAWCA